MCEAGCMALLGISEGNSSVQKSICEMGGLVVLLEILRKYDKRQKLVFVCCSSIAAVLSSQETHSKYCTGDVLRAVGKCCEMYEDSEKFLRFLLCLMRKEDLRVKDAVGRGVCAKEALPKCKEDDCKWDKGFYCPKCCVQQKAFRCLACDKDEIKFYCETCIKRDHQGHECEEFFYPVKCATKKQ